MANCSILFASLINLCFLGQLLLGVICADSEDENNRPLVGIVAMRITDEKAMRTMPIKLQGKYYISASYVKFIEMAGAQVVPIFPSMDDEKLEKIFSSVNGLLFPGGETNLVSSGYYKVTKKLFNMAIKANTVENGFFPILGICRGMQALATHLYGNLSLLSNTNSKNYTTTLRWNKDTLPRSIFSNIPAQSLEESELFNITAHFHKYSITMKTYEDSTKFKETYKVIATSNDREGVEFISIFQGSTLPFFGLQFHPEKVMFEWADSITIPHSSKAVRLSQHFANIFLDQVRKNKNKFSSKAEQGNYIISKLNPVYMGHIVSHSPFVQIYVF